jgi:phenylpyruvate tautomerase
VQISLDNINPEANEKYSKAFFDFFHKKLKVPGDRGYMYAPLLLPGIGRV